MFSSLTRIFHSPSQQPTEAGPSGSASSARLPNKGKGRAYGSSLTLPESTRDAASGSAGGSSLNFPAHPLSRTPSYPSSLALDKVRQGPSHVSWITSTTSSNGSPSVSPSPSRPVLRSNVSIDSASASNGPGSSSSGVIHRDGIWRFPPLLANAILGGGDSGNRSSGARMSADSGSLHLQSVYLSDVDSNSVISASGIIGMGGQAGSRPLSPIDESNSQGQSPSESGGHISPSSKATFSGPSRPISEQMHSPVQPPTPSSNSSVTPVPTPTALHPTFLTRPLRRSISQTSTSTTTGTFLTPTSTFPPSAVSATSGHTLAYGFPAVYQQADSGTVPVGGSALAAGPSSLTMATAPVETRPPFTGASLGSLHFPLPIFTSTRRAQVAAPPSLPTVLASPQPYTHHLPTDSRNLRTHVSIIYEYEDSISPRESTATGPGVGPWRQSQRSVSFVTAPSVHFSEPDYADEDLEEDEEDGVESGSGRQRWRNVVYDVQPRDASSVFEDINRPDAEEGAGGRTSYLEKYKAETESAARRERSEPPEEEEEVDEEVEEEDEEDEEEQEQEADIGDSRSHMSLPEGYCDVELGPPLEGSQAADASSGIGEVQTRPVSWTSTFLHKANRAAEESEYEGSDVVSVETDSDETMVERAIARRWLQGLSWGSFRSFRNSMYVATRRRRSMVQASRMQAKGKGKEKEKEVDLEAGGVKPERKTALSGASAAFILFFLGFFAPWCWLIGGWCLCDRTGHLKESEGQFVDTVDRHKIWWPKREHGADPTTMSGKRRTWSLFAARNTRSAASDGRAGRKQAEERTPMTPIDTSLDSGASVHPVYSLHLSPQAQQDSRAESTGARSDVEVSQVIDKWVRRCRIAAIVSGVLLLIAVIIALVIVCGVRAK